jgi:PIN domain nuclease of toxin-antitoxin system
MSNPERALLLDTHVWLWLMSREGNMKPSAIRVVEEAAHFGLVGVSAISVWEVAMLEAKGRIRLSKDRLSWVNEALRAPGLGLIPLTPEIAVDSSRLPGVFHGDPADRILVATARRQGAILLTRDEKILSYGKAKHLSVMAV